MPYNPGISYHGDQYLAQGITSAANSISDTIKKYGEENELVKSYRSVAKNTPGFYDAMGISKEEMGGMGNKDVIALFKGYALQTTLQDQKQQRQFAIDANNRAIAAAQLAATQETRLATQETRLKASSEAASQLAARQETRLNAYYEARSLEDISQSQKNNASVAAANSEQKKQTSFNEKVYQYLTENPNATSKEQSAAILAIAYASDLSPESIASIFKTSSAYNKDEIKYDMINGIMHYSNNGSVYRPVNNAQVQEVLDPHGVVLGHRVGSTWVPLREEKQPNALERYLTPKDKGAPATGAPPKGAPATGAPPKGAPATGAPTAIYVDEDGVPHIVEQPKNPKKRKQSNANTWGDGE